MLSTACAIGCTKEKIVIESQGGRIADLRVTAEAGQCTVAVETEGGWRVEEADAATWVHFDVMGGTGNGAFTLYYDSNESDIVDLRMNRMARIVVVSSDRYRADTICLKQAGTPALLVFREQRIELSAFGADHSAQFSTNLPDPATQLVAQSDAAWIGRIGLDVQNNVCTFTTESNDTGRSRTGSVTLRFIDSWGDSYVSTLTVTQKP